MSKANGETDFSYLDRRSAEEGVLLDEAMTQARLYGDVNLDDVDRQIRELHHVDGEAPHDLGHEALEGVNG